MVNSMQRRIELARNRQDLGAVISFFQDILDAHVARLEETYPPALLFERELRQAISYYDEVDAKYLLREARFMGLREAAEIVRMRFGIWATTCL